ncbi:ComEC/Rec2 family competence protein [Aequorivita sediminis]|uniref:ComEC/Rec2 family competence protein n=1 Tax=Aequorivita sediminis TaxID=3073653 RepID=UPI0028B1068A|nr:ComEC/Rec2 family competence protein [Aequorivita sp. F6058]
MKFINFAIVRFSIFLTIGILSAHFYPITTFLLPYLLALIFVFVLFWFRARKQLFQTVELGIVTYLCFFAIGYVSYQMRLPMFQSNHYSHNSTTDTPETLQLKITETLKDDNFNHKYLAEIYEVNGKHSKGNVLVNVSKDSIENRFLVDDLILVYSTISNIPKSLNPHQFEYSKYMKSLGVYGQLHISKKEIIKHQIGASTLRGFAQNRRARIIEKLKKTKLETDERAIMQALVLGEKKDIDKNLYEKYAAAGAVHILAVSGLHVSIIYFILSFVLKPLSRFKYGSLIQVIAIVLSLWGFALLSGLSPSVTRAVTMFSFFALAEVLNRDTNAVNTLFLSYFTLLVFNPFLLFQVGFQLSYLAVFFIIWLLPVFQNIGYSKNKVIRKVWTLIAVTICAQIGVLPLSLFYFNQFPGLFLLTNIIILPFLSILMCGGILIVILASFDFLPNWLAESYNYLIEKLNWFINWIATQEHFLLGDIHFSTLKTLSAYMVIIAFTLYLKKLSYPRLIASLATVVLLISVYIYDENRYSRSQLVVFQKNRQTLLAYQNGKDLSIFKSDSTESLSHNYPIRGFKTKLNITSYSEKTLPSIFKYKDKKILIVDSLGVYPSHKNIHTIILSNSPKINLNRLIDSINPSQIIADGSNYYSYVDRWEQTCKLKKLPFSHTAKQGAFLLE